MNWATLSVDQWSAMTAGDWDQLLIDPPAQEVWLVEAANVYRVGGQMQGVSQ